MMRRSNPDALGLLAVVGLLGAGALLLAHAATSKTPTSPATTTPSGPTIPSDLVQRELNAYYGYQSQHGRAPTDRATWILVMQDSVAPYSSLVWGYIYDQGIGYIAQHHTIADEATQEAWLTTALAQYGH